MKDSEQILLTTQ